MYSKQHCLFDYLITDLLDLDKGHKDIFCLKIHFLSDIFSIQNLILKS